ncbi:LLM class flavin-dependent oxidoreductase [Planomonospora venezuelensis]|uniref:FMN-dependent oxidoreductase (Nitrilotriacetate monooxygenase family) n=1 Tax=Planomonospora venezuelensis TaxID=1999 RepID=A0A841DG39_PLAVE|nr:LLM class flavin-dependent oxidoreductase [Planomonospora venezuelensis]MBB5967055.1 FMN-dependent oxidoreductase (nitrilotriacetate monooxygenase family) [Planomonospora venezuelensis]GIN04895.1 monooxygenase [Planomonospora venezuelensis]
MPTRTLHLNAFLMGVGHHEAAWRHPRTEPARLNDVRHYQQLARIAERGRLDSLFLADGLALQGDVRHNAIGGLEPLTLLSALAAVTDRIGLIATVSTTYNEPFHVARKFASLDHISGGRAGWNIVTSAGEAEAHNFGTERPAHADRYARATEFLEVVTGLWDGWEDGAVVGDRRAGVYADTGRIHALDHDGAHFRVRGPLTTSRPPQGHPLLVQAGSSEDGKEFAARHAEAVFTAQQTLAGAREFYADLKGRLARYGRHGDELLVLPGISPIIGSTEREALRLEKELEDLVIPAYGLAQLSNMTGIELSHDDLDRPLPDVPVETEGAQSRRKLVIDLARRENLTVRQLLSRLAGGRGHRVVAGTPEQIADEIQAWFTGGAADGFNIMPPVLPGGLEDFVDHVVPELQIRGLFRTEYEGRTLREHYGLARPASRHARPAAAGRLETAVAS